MLRPTELVPILLHMVVSIWVCIDACPLACELTPAHLLQTCTLDASNLDSLQTGPACFAYMSPCLGDLHMPHPCCAGQHLHSLPAADHCGVLGARLRLELGHHPGSCFRCAVDLVFLCSMSLETTL
jgi:hypothetical protein